MLKHVLLMLATFQQWTLIQGQSRQCFECTNIPSISLCKTTTTCTTDQACFIEQSVTSSGRVVYDAGCLSTERCSAISGRIDKRNAKRGSDIVTCATCCHGDMCNSKGCSTEVIPRDQRGPYCYSCPSMNHPDDCDEVQVCEKHERCLLHILPEFQTYPVRIYTGQCERSDVCDALSKRPMTGRCPTQCCDTDFCNTHCFNTSGTLQVTTPPVTSTVYIKTTTLPHIVSSSSSSTPLHTTVKQTSSTQMENTPLHTMSTSIAPPSSSYKTSIFTSKSTTTHFNHARCNSNGYTHVPGTNLCINPHTHTMSWLDARKACQTENADLLIVTSDHDRNALTKYFHGHGVHHESQYWIGIREPANSAVYMTVNNVSITHFMWIHGQPSAHGGGSCIRMRYKEDFLWDDDACTDHHKYICQLM